jgi:hypothetical protein
MRTLRPNTDQLTNDYDTLRASLVARGALGGPNHWNQLVTRCRRKAKDAQDFLATLTAEAAKLPGTNDRTKNTNPND